VLFRSTAGKTRPYLVRAVRGGAAASSATLTVLVAPAASGSITKDPAQQEYLVGDAVSLTAVTAANYTFSHWSGDADGSENPLALVLAGETTITANFAPIVVAAPIADFEATPLSGEAPLVVTFTDRSQNIDAVDGPSWSWTFGDGQSSSLQHPTNIYSAAGKYTVTLTVTTGNGTDSLTRTNYITVTEPVVTGFQSIDIKANGSDGPLIVAASTPVAITVTMDPGAYSGQNADWWLVAKTPLAPPADWYSYVHPQGWLPGIRRALAGPLSDLAPTEVLNMPLPAGDYLFYFGVDDNTDGTPEGTWLDTVAVKVTSGG